MDKFQAYNSFWNSFGLKAYDETSVPDGTPMPYITYESSSDSFGYSMSLSAQLWYRDSSWKDITLKAEQISDAITRGGKLVSYDEGAFWILRGTPFTRRMSEPDDDTVRRLILNVDVEFID